MVPVLLIGPDRESVGPCWVVLDVTFRDKVLIAAGSDSSHPRCFSRTSEEEPKFLLQKEFSSVFLFISGTTEGNHPFFGFN